MAATYQFASDAFGGNAYSGVIKADGKWVACEADSDLWNEFRVWRAVEGNVPDPWRSPADGGVVIVLEEGQEAVGSMLDSLPPPPPPPEPPPPPPPEEPVNLPGQPP